MTKFELDFKLDFKFNLTLNLKFSCKPKLLFKNLKTTFISNLDINMRLMKKGLALFIAAKYVKKSKSPPFLL